MDVLADAGAPDGGDGGAAPLKTFSFPSVASSGKMVSDDTGGQGGVAAALLDANGATFVYVTTDGSKRFNEGTVISTASGVQVTLANYLGSYVVSIFDSAASSSQAVVSGCH
jgi:hypothetical protein